MTSTTAERPLAAVTGASEGLGYELARQFARAGFDLVVCADDDDIDSVANAFEVEGARVTAVRCDLGHYGEVQAFFEKIIEQRRPLEAIAINASGCVSGGFAGETDLQEELRMIQLNVAATVQLARLAAAPMVGRGRGRIAITASVAATMPAPRAAVYGATQAFTLAFAAALRRELSDSGVSVTTLLPGPPDTEFFERECGWDMAPPGAGEGDPADVATRGFAGLMAGTGRVYASAPRSTQLQEMTARFIPESVKARSHETVMEPRARGR